MSQGQKSRKPLNAYQLKKFIGEFGDLFYNGAKLMCKACDKPLMCWSKSDCTRHVNSVQHQLKKREVPLQTQFKCDLLLMSIVCNIPLHVVGKHPFRKFWHKYNPQFQLPSRATLWNHIPTVRNDVIEKITYTLQNKRLWLCVDKITDRKKNSIVNIIVRVLDPQRSTFPLLLASKRLAECTSSIITQMILDMLEKFKVATSQILLLVTDGVALMRSLGRSLSQHGCRLLHITCKVHALHLVVESIRQCFPNVDALIASTNRVFLKSLKCLRLFHKEYPKIPEPPQPIHKCWGTWLKAAFYYAEYFQQIKSVVLQFNQVDAASIKRSQIQFQDTSIERDLKTIRTNYKVVADAIDKLQNSTMGLAESLEVLDEVDSLLHDIDDARNEHVKRKFESALENDTDFNRLRQVWENIANMDSFSEYKEYFTYACVTSVDVGRSFSKYKNVFSPLRASLSETNIEAYLMLQSFYESSPIYNVYDPHVR